MMDTRRSLFELTRPSAGASLAIADLQRQVTAAFTAAGLESATLDARLLIAGVLGLDRAVALRAPELQIGVAALPSIEIAARRRLDREPVSRILGLRAFHGLDLEIGPATLDPRPETETLVDGVLDLVARGRMPGGAGPRILDVGTGSGAIIVALLCRLPEATGVATDISAEALAIAKRNASRHGVHGRLSLHTTSWLEGITGPFDVIVSNPPYIPSDHIAALDPEVRTFDPEAALDGGSDGLAPYRVLVPAAARLLAPGGWLVLEHGQGQSTELVEFANACQHYESVAPESRWPDLAGTLRCVALQSRIDHGAKKLLGTPR